MEKTTDEQILHLKWKVVIPVVVSLLIATNTVTGFIFKQNKNTEQIEYNADASRRRIKNAIKELNYQIEIKDLKEKLKECNSTF